MTTELTGRKRPGAKLHLKRTLVAYTFILPNFIGYMVLTFVPIVLSFVYSLSEWNLGVSKSFVGITNFRYMLFEDLDFWQVVWNTFYYTIGTVPICLILSLLLAILMNQRMKGKVFFRSVFFFPYVASLVAVAVVWMALFNPDKGPVNEALRSIGVKDPPGWAGTAEWAMPTVIGLTIWKQTGYYMVVYLAALQGVPTELYEAARMDGANAFQRFLHVTWPMVTPTTFFVSMMLIIGTFKSYDIMYVTTQGGPGTATKVLAYHIYNNAFVYMKFGYASALSVFLFFVVLLITLIQFRGEKRFTNYL
ncbi:MAG: sugar ABC transporter permease [Clostridia bacterium]|nr:sugar ABC transporter permease [Clostridia bacterium]